jgi:putative lipase involved disintegration of autophagic bodies
MLKTLEEMGAKYAFTYRDNVFDRAICVTRDCFQKTSLGYQVFSNGTEADLCFQRRQFSQEKILAYINNTDVLIDFMKRMKQQNEERMVFYKPFVSPAEMWSYEDLFLFEYTDSQAIYDQSVKAWSSFLRNFADIQETKVEKALRLYRNSRPPPSPHSDVVYNIESVTKELSKDPMLKGYVRE